MVQVLPADDTFQKTGAGVYGSHLCGWIRTQAWTSQPGSYAAGATEWSSELVFDDSSNLENHITSGHSTVLSLTGPSTPAVCLGNNNTGFPKLYGWTFRNSVNTSVQVSAQFSVIQRGNIPFLGGNVRFHGIGTRIRGTLTASGDSAFERIASCDGYYFVRGAGTTPSGYKYYLIRVNGGTMKRIAVPLENDGTELDENEFVGPYADVSDGLSFRLRMTVINNSSGDVELRCYAGTFVSGFGFVETLVITHTDTDSDQILASGRSGFCMTGERWTASPDRVTAHACTWFQASNFVGSTLHFREEWKRTKIFDAIALSTTNGYTPFKDGFALNCGWTGDLYGLDNADIPAGADYRLMLDYDAGEDAVQVTRSEIDETQNGSEVAWFWSQRQADNVNQHRSIDVKWPAETDSLTVARKARLCLRESDSASVSDVRFFQGYYFDIQRTDAGGGTDAIARLHRRNFDGANGTKTIGAAVTLTIVADQWYEMEMEVIDVETSPGDSQVRIKCYLDSTQVVFADPGVNNVTVLADGTVFDGQNDRLQTGLGEGFGCNLVAAHEDDSLFFRNFQIGGSAGGSTPPEDQATISLSEEGVGAVGTLVVPADWPIQKTAELPLVQHAMEAAYDYTLLRAPFMRRRWLITARAVTTAERDALVLFWTEHGVAIPFAWVSDEGEEVVVHFTNEELQHALRAPSIHSFEFEIEELNSAFIDQDEAKHLVIIYIDDPPPLALFQEDVWGYNPNDASTVPAATDSAVAAQNLYPETTVIDALAADGIIFTKAMNTSVCSPGRAQMHTGAYAHHNGLGSIVRDDRSYDQSVVFEFGETAYAPDNIDYTPTRWGGKLLAKALGDLASPDVHKGFIGKMHFSSDAVETPIGLEWDIIDKASESNLGRLGEWDFRCTLVNNHNNHPVPGPGGSGEAPDSQASAPANGSHYFFRYKKDLTSSYDELNIGTIDNTEHVSPSPTGSGTATDENTDGQWSTSFLVDEAITFMNSIPLGKRGFLYLPLTLAHSPFDSAPYSMIDTDEYKDMGDSPNSEAAEDEQKITIWKRQLGMMEGLDQEIGRLRSSMDADVLAKTTFIIIADNGVDETFVGHALTPPSTVNTTKDFGTEWGTLDSATEDKFKKSVFKNGVASQVIMSGPGVVNTGSSVRKVKALVDIGVDLYSTIIEYFGGEVTWPTDGHSLVPLMSNQQNDSQFARQYNFSYNWYPNGAITDILVTVSAWDSTTTYSMSDVVAWEHHHWSSDAGGNLNNEPGVSGWTVLDIRRDIVVRMVLSGITTPPVSDDLRNGTFTLHRHLGGTDGQSGNGVINKLYHTHKPDNTLDDFNELTELSLVDYNAQAGLLSVKMNGILGATDPGDQN